MPEYSWTNENPYGRPLSAQLSQGQNYLITIIVSTIITKLNSIYEKKNQTLLSNQRISF